MSNIAPLNGASATARETAPNPVIVARLEEALELARSGAIQNFAIAYINSAHPHEVLQRTHQMQNYGTAARITLGLEQIKHEVLVAFEDVGT